MTKKEVQQMIDESLKKFKQKHLSFRSRIIVDNPTDTYQVTNKKTG